MRLNEAKEILKNNGYMCESKQNEVVLLDTYSSKYTLEDVRDWKEDDSIEEDSEEYWEKHEDDYNESKILQNLIRGKMVKKITKDMIGY